MDDESAPQPRVVYVFFSFHYFTLAEIIVCKYLIRLSPPHFQQSASRSVTFFAFICILRFINATKCSSWNNNNL